MLSRSPTPNITSLPYPQPHPNLSDPDLGINIDLNIKVNTEAVGLKSVYTKRDGKRVGQTGEIGSLTIDITAQRTLTNGDAGFHVPAKKNMNVGGTDFGNLGR